MTAMQRPCLARIEPLGQIAIVPEVQIADLRATHTGQIDLRRVVWRRVIDMNDRALRDIVCSLGGVSNGFPRETGFDITVASEVMAIVCLATDLDDLQRRLGDMIGKHPA